MPVLLLAQGDATAKDMLRQAIEARYGQRPPVLDSLKIEFKGRTKVKVGPINTWVPVETVAYFRFPDAMRWDFTARPMRLPVQRGVEAYDGETYWSIRGNRGATVINDEAQVRSARQRLWAVASVMLTPLSELFVKLMATGGYSLSATNTKLDDSANIYLRENYTMNYVSVNCLNPDTGVMQDFVIKVAETQKNINDLLMPAKMTMAWDGDETFELEPTHAEANPTIAARIFSVEAEA